ncbi:MAG: hypothetical protein ABIV48_04090 [Pyrinomonadaceae bacterium]
MAENTNDTKQTLTGLARRLGQLPGDKKRAALEMSAALAGVSLRVSREFVEAVPKAAKILSADDLRHWGELGRRLAMGNADTGATFFADGVSGLKLVPDYARHLIFQICTRQLVLSSSISLATFKLIPQIAKEIGDEKLLTAVLTLASEIAQRSAKHSSEFLESTPGVARALGRFGEKKGEVAAAVLELASQFANRTGGMTADLWAGLPSSLDKLTSENAILLIRSAGEFLEFGGSVTLHFVSSGSDVLLATGPAFDEWCRLARLIARQGNAVLISFLRATPKFFGAFRKNSRGSTFDDLTSVLRLTAKIAETDAESALAAFKSSPGVLNRVTIDQFEQWVETGLSELETHSSKARRSYFALETRASNERLHKTRLGLPLEKIQTILRMYVEALTGK